MTGLGHVGRALSARFEGYLDIVAFDLATGEPYPATEISECAIDFICVGTPAATDGSCDLRQVEAAVRRSPAPLIVIKSTIPPGTADRLSAQTGKRIVFSPEYFGEGSHSSDFWSAHEGVTFTILGGEARDCEVVAGILSEVTPNSHRTMTCSALDAEVVKYMENAFLAVKIAFVNEFFELVATLGASWVNVREGWLLDPRVGRSHTTVFPERRGFGGRCLTKDVSAILSTAHALGLSMQVLEGAVASNQTIREGIS